MKRGYEMRKWQSGLFFLMVCFFLVGCSSDNTRNSDSVEQEDESVELFVSAAASMTDAMAELKTVYEANNNVQLTFNFAGSGKLAQQIQQGAPVDVFISANEHWIDQLITEHQIDENTVNKITSNKLVLITKNDSNLSLSSFEDITEHSVEQIAIGNPESVPAGEYTEKALSQIGMWDELRDKFVFTQNVRQVLTYVETGNADIGFVYESDALITDGVKILAFSNPDTHDSIIYRGAITTRTELKQAGIEFMEFLLSTESQAILENYGFH